MSIHTHTYIYMCTYIADHLYTRWVLQQQLPSHLQRIMMLTHACTIVCEQVRVCWREIQCVCVAYSSTLHCVALCLHCATMCYSVLQSVAVCCSALQCATTRTSTRPCKTAQKAGVNPSLSFASTSAVHSSTKNRVTDKFPSPCKYGYIYKYIYMYAYIYGRSLSDFLLRFNVSRAFLYYMHIYIYIYIYFIYICI